MSPVIFALKWLRTQAIAANEHGIPIPLIRDQHMNRGRLPGTMFAVSFVVALGLLAGKVVKLAGDVEYSNVLWLLGVTGSFWVIEALGKNISISKEKIEVGAKTDDNQS